MLKWIKEFNSYSSFRKSLKFEVELIWKQIDYLGKMFRISVEA